MTTPIYDFVKKYADSGTSRLHMPAHKGKSLLGCEPMDITEISGADVLYSADGIIAQSEDNASRIFGSAHTFYSTEGSSLCIKAMLSLAVSDTKRGERALVLAGRNAHKAFIYAAALLDIDVEWLYPSTDGHLCECKITAEDVENALARERRRPAAVYITSPDYLGNIADVSGIAEVCDRYGVPLLVDNAHGAYLGLLSPSAHPLDLGASMCCDSAHKTLPVLTGGAYLHVAKKAKKYVASARSALAIFASTSPSYLTLASLDICNKYISDGYAERLSVTADRLKEIKLSLRSKGFSLAGDEPLKLTLSALSLGYTGEQLADELRRAGVECEFADREYVVLMVSAENTDTDLERVTAALCALPQKQAVTQTPLRLERAKDAPLSIREAVFSPRESVRVTQALGRICASPTVSCPPAVPIAVSGERITENMTRVFERYGIEYVEVVK